MEKNTHDFVRSCLVAGWAECFHWCKVVKRNSDQSEEIQNSEEIISCDGIDLADVWSLYSSALGFAGDSREECEKILGIVPMFPWGWIENVKEFDESKLGVYECIVTQMDPKRKNVIPLRAWEEIKESAQVGDVLFDVLSPKTEIPLNWKSKESFKCRLCSVDVWSVRKIFGPDSV